MTISKRCFDVYSIDVHPHPERVFDWIRQNWDVTDWLLDEYVGSLRGFCKHYDLTLADWSISATGHRSEFVKITIPDEIAEMSGVRLWKYLQRHYSTYHCQFTGQQRDALAGGCPFTGMIYDEDALDPMREFIRRPDSRTWRELVDDCVASLIQALHREAEYRYSDEALREDCEANDYLFYERGAIA